MLYRYQSGPSQERARQPLAAWRSPNNKEPHGPLKDRGVQGALSRMRLSSRGRGRKHLRVLREIVFISHTRGDNRQVVVHLIAAEDLAEFRNPFADLQMSEQCLERLDVGLWHVADCVAAGMALQCRV